MLKAALAAVLFGLVLPVRAAQFEGGPLRGPAPIVVPAGPSLLWTAAGLPSLEAPVWQSLQQGDAAALYASGLIAARAEAEPALKSTLLVSAAAQRLAAARPAQIAAAKAAVAQAAPHAMASVHVADLTRLSDGLEQALSSENPAAALAELDARFDLSSWKPAGDAALPLLKESGPAALAPAAPGGHATAAAPPAPAHAAAKKKALGLVDLVALGLNSIIGAGIFIKPAQMFGASGYSSIFAFPLTALLLVPVALTFAEAGTYFHGKDGGAYQYTRGAFPEKGAASKVGEWASFGVTWMAWIALLFGWAAVTSVIAMNLAYFVPVLANPLAGKALAAVAIAVVSYINYRGVKEGAAVSNAFALAKILPMLAFIAVGLTMVHPVAMAHAAPIKLAALGSASFMAFFALQGFENIAVPGGEVHEPAKNLPRAIILSLLIASLVYAGIHVVCLGLTTGLATSTKPVVDAGYAMLGAAGAGVMALCAFFSTTGDSAAAALFGARFVKVLADDDHIPGSAQIRKIHPRFGTPHVAIALTSTLTIASLFLPLDTLMDVSSIAVAAQYLGTCLALPFLRRRHQPPAGSFRLPGGPIIPIAGALSALALSVAGGFGSLTIDFALLGLGFALKGGWSLYKRLA